MAIAPQFDMPGIFDMSTPGSLGAIPASGPLPSPSSTGFVPSNNPDYLGVVVLHGLKGEEASGGRVAAPVFSDIMDEIYMLNELEI